jgi:tRNA threonylcarbamoyladenosine biosynthesis protein TsaE
MDFPTFYRTKNAQETQEVGYSFANYLTEHKKSNSATILTLSGQLGAGKTTFLQGFARGLGVEGRFISPTFLLVRQYTLPSDTLFYHLDLYRISEARELATLGIEEIFEQKDGIVAIEWPEKLSNQIPKPYYALSFTSQSAEEREIKIEFVSL